MATVRIDHIAGGLSADVDRGAIRRLKRPVQIQFEPAELNQARDHTVLSLALEVLYAQGYTPLSNFGSIGYTTSMFGGLVLVNHRLAVMPDEPHFINGSLEYEHILDGPNQFLINPPGGRLFVKGKSSIVEKSTNFFYKEGDNRQPRTLLEVAHTFQDATELGVTNLPFDRRFPRTIVQTGEVNIPYPQMNFSIQALALVTGVGTDTIYNLANQLVGKCNSDDDGTLLGAKKYTYLCSEMSWELNDVSQLSATAFGLPNFMKGKASYKVSLEFQYNHDTWDPTVVFNDQRTGRPPARVMKATQDNGTGVVRFVPNPIVPVLIQPAGYWQVPALGRVNFQGFLGATFEKIK